MKNFNTEAIKAFGKVGKHKISVFFNINKEGAVNNLKVRAQYPGFETEVIRVINLLPTFKPGEYNGEVVSTNYYLPIKFEIK
jgi:protein TonB